MPFNSSGKVTLCFENTEKRNADMAYKTIVVDYAPKAKIMAAEVEDAANEMERDGWELVTFAITGSAKGILVFHQPDEEPED